MTTMTPDFEPTAVPFRDDTALRVLVLGAVYAAAVFFAVAFSPTMGFVTPYGIPAAHLAATGQPVTVGR